MSLHCKLVMLRLDDMQDLVLMIDGKFRKRSNFFEFEKTFQKLQQMMKIRASIKNVDLLFTTFLKKDNVLQSVSY
jgi:hypothetical protein